MEISLFLAKAWGIYLIIVSTAVLLQKNHYEKILLSFENQGLMLFAGAMTLMIGIIHIVTHTIWTPDFRAVITLLGWLTFTKGVAILFVSQRMISFSKSVRNSPFFPMLLITNILVGAYLLYAGFMLPI